ncbi:MAG: hypothetical protein V3T41_07105 [bacterium]
MKRKAVLTGALAILLTAAASATNWHLYKSWRAPAPNVRGYAFHSPYHYVLTDGSPPRIWRFDFEKFDSPINLQVPRGAWGLEKIGPVAFWVSNYNNSYIYKVNMTGSVVSSFRCPRDHPGEIGGTGLGGYLAVAIPKDNLALLMTTAGSVVRTFPGPGTRLTAWHSYNGLLAGDDITHKVYTYAGTVNVASPAGISPGNWPMSAPYSNFFVTDMATNTVQGWVWGGVVPVGPSSLGRVKALFK